MDDPQDLQEEIELLRNTGQGDRRSLERLYDKFSGILYATALRVLNNTDDAQDVLQDVFVMIWEKAATYDPARGKPLTWAITMTRNKAIDRLRSIQRRLRLRSEVEEETHIQNQSVSLGASEDVTSSEDSDLLHQALGQLPAEQRESIELAFFKGLTQQEISEQLALPLGTVKARIRRGMIKLQSILKTRR